MLEVIGWLVVVAVALGISIFCLACWFNLMGEYNIGGVPNKWYEKVFVLVFTVIVVFGWKWVVSISPFSITLH